MTSELPLELVDEIGSTSEALKARAATGSPEMALLARRQVAGHGRMGRPWLSVAGNLYLSVLLRPGATRFPGHWSLLSALALADAVRPHLPDPALLRLKWPNDVLLGRGKLAGILLESAAAPCPWLVIGFGVNLAGAPAGLDREVACLAAFGPPPQPLAFARTVLTALTTWRARYAAAGFAPIAAGWLAAAHRPGDPVTARLGSQHVHGTFRGLGPDGSLLLNGPAGPRTIMAGELS